MIGELVTAGASLLGGLFGQKKTDDRIDQQMEFQERMSNSAYQRSMKDMRKAGLNPILAYSKGGASAPAGSMAPAFDVVSPAVSSALQTRRVNAEVQNMVETNKNLIETNKNLEAERGRIGATTANILADTKIKQELFQSALRDASKAKSEEEWYKTDIGSLMRKIGLGASELGKIFGGN